MKNFYYLLSSTGNQNVTECQQNKFLAVFKIRGGGGGGVSEL